MALVLPLRPDRGGTMGQRIRVTTNFYPVTQLPSSDLVHYSTEVIPDVPPPVARDVFRNWVSQNAARIQGVSPIFDGRANTYAPAELWFGKEATFDVILPERGGGSRRKPQEFKIKLFLVATIRMEDLHRFVSGQAPLASTTSIQALDVLIRYAMTAKHTSVGRSIYVGNITFRLPGGVEAWQGYYQSVRPAQGRVLVNVDVSSTVFYSHGPLIDIICQFFEIRTPKDIRSFDTMQHSRLTRFIKGLKVRVTHRKDFRPKYSVRALSILPANQATFTLEDGTEKTVEQYFHEKYNYTLSYPFLPCIEVSKGTLFPMEVCDVEPNQRYIRRLDEEQTAQMIKFTTQKPEDRMRKITEGMRIFRYDENEEMRNFGMKVGTELVSTEARILPPPRVLYHPASRAASIVPRGGAWNLRDKRVTRGAVLTSWAILVLAPPNALRRNEVENFVRETCAVFHDTGLQVENRTPPIIPGNPAGDLSSSLKEAYNAAGNQAKAQPQIIFCILANPASSIYGEVKRVGDTMLGVTTQCLRARFISRPTKQYLANVCLKILDPQALPFLREVPTIVMGADVSHPGPGSRFPSIAAVVGTLDHNLSSIFATTSVQETRVEVIANLKAMVQATLKAFYAAARTKPLRILFYRDGVGEGQFVEILEKEVAAIREACRSLEEGYAPLITFVVVQKRHHVRFFPQNEQNMDRSRNCMPGTVVDTNITHPVEYDFYLQSHAGIQGMSRSAHYHVLLDENKLGSDALQQMTYEQCHLYARCTQSVSLVPVAYYADLAAARARFHSKDGEMSDTMSEASFSSEASYREVKENLRQKMYFM